MFHKSSINLSKAQNNIKKLLSQEFKSHMNLLKIDFFNQRVLNTKSAKKTWLRDRMDALNFFKEINLFFPKNLEMSTQSFIMTNLLS